MARDDKTIYEDDDMSLTDEGMDMADRENEDEMLQEDIG